MDIIGEVSKIRELNRKIKALKAEQDALISDVKAFMGDDHDELYSEDDQLLATWKWHDVTRFNSKDLKSEHPDIYSLYLVTQPTRKFLIK